jgi:hypothetical protein
MTEHEKDRERLLMCVEEFIRHIHCDGDSDIRREDIPQLLDAIADEFEKNRDGIADALQVVKDLLILFSRVRQQSHHAERIAEKVGVKLTILRGTPAVSWEKFTG